MSIDRSELRLVWPPGLFAAEARALLEAGEVTDHAMGWLLAEAFHGDAGFQLFQQEHNRGGGAWASEDPWAPNYQAGGVSPRTPAEQLIVDLVADADNLPAYRPKRYYRARQVPGRGQLGRWNLPMVMYGFAELVNELAEVGYFGRAFGSSCCDDADDPAGEGQRQLSELLAENQEDDDPLVQLWPPLPAGEDGPTGEEWRGPQRWSDGLFYDVVEALHDLVARPRHRFWHDHCEEWDYADLTRAPGQAVYRWRVNQLLDRSNVPLRLAEDGEDVGLLVTSAGDARDDLVDQVLRTADPTVRELVAHAVSQFRSRDATPLAKRGATKHLADVLELRKGLLKRELFSGDEDDLFQIANRFQIRHLSEQQKGNYNPAFLDWIFWWYLGTIELTNTLLERQSGPA